MSNNSFLNGANAVAKEFFNLYQSQNVPGMIALFEPAGEVEYVPFGLVGPVDEVGPGSWGVLIDSFPDLNNTVNSIKNDANDRTAFVDVNIAGTQVKEAFGVPSLGRGYDLRHFFIIEVNENNKIVKVTSFWDNAEWFRQLGKTDI